MPRNPDRRVAPANPESDSRPRRRPQRSPRPDRGRRVSDVPAPEVGTEVELEVGPVAHGGRCVARLDGRVVFVRHTLPGERVRARVTEGGPSFWRADAVEVLQASPDRVESRLARRGSGRRGRWRALARLAPRTAALEARRADRAAAAAGPHRPGVAGPRGHRRGRARRRRAPRPALPHPDRPGGRRRRARGEASGRGAPLLPPYGCRRRWIAPTTHLVRASGVETLGAAGPETLSPAAAATAGSAGEPSAGTVRSLHR